MIGRSRASVELSKLDETQEEIARALHVTQELVSQWISGKKRPGDGNRAALEKIFGIKSEWWDEPASPKEAPSTPFVHMSVRQRALVIEQSIHELLEKAAIEDTTNKRAIVTERCVKMLANLGKMTGESLDLAPAQIIRSLAMKRVLDTIARVLEDDPETMRRIGEALAELSGEGERAA